MKSVTMVATTALSGAIFIVWGWKTWALVMAVGILFYAHGWFWGRAAGV